MDQKFWLERWENKNLGFNQEKTNSFLMNFFPELSLSPNSSILVPLCGKSIDLLWPLKQGFQVTGVELSPIAIQDFFKEQNISYTKKNVGPYISWQANNHKLRILEGDFFNILSLGDSFAGIYDRASLVALPQSMRQNYYGILKALKASVFLITIEYEQKKVDGPPFSISEKEILESLKEDFNILIRHSEKSEAVSPRFLEKGVKDVLQKVYLLKKL
ncbi:MAG: thiopurine S-methyltransferase [Bdellovibrionota bacterium]|nr:thiopurine S-methyltransferase [Bdellovibrionota bacterium]